MPNGTGPVTKAVGAETRLQVIMGDPDARADLHHDEVTWDLGDEIAESE
jgi:hypothetical protein